MSNIALIIEERATSIGNFMVGRLLPFREKRAVGPFVFIDHMGPVKMKEYENFDVPPHPHIGLSTLTYLFEGAIMHRDSTGAVEEIQPGAVNWMTAGKGVVHSERTPEHLRNSEKSLHGLQIWVALPRDKEETAPVFNHIGAEELPQWQQDGVSFKLIAGEAFGRKSPVPVYSPLYFIEIKNTDNASLNIGNHLFGESALYILEGSVQNDGYTYEPRQILIAKDSSLCEFEMAPNSTVYIFGGEPFPEEHFIYWNFVSSDKSRIEKAREDWLNQVFPKVPGETGFVPLPQAKK
ncbi:MAG: pirin family protein [Chitinophagaceae bacterium]|nr:pirin family protein [Chitinophagaceae bacterium]MCW5927519.1 pirin family protein [Chitinophagaceae bacterium]